MILDVGAQQSWWFRLCCRLKLIFEDVTSLYRAADCKVILCHYLGRSMSFQSLCYQSKSTMFFIWLHMEKFVPTNLRNDCKLLKFLRKRGYFSLIRYLPHVTYRTVYRLPGHPVIYRFVNHFVRSLSLYLSQLSFWSQHLLCNMLATTVTNITSIISRLSFCFLRSIRGHSRAWRI